MGYYTGYSLVIEGGNNDIIKELRKENQNAEYALDDNGDTEECIKWYEHEEDFRKFSMKHPEILFSLHGEGEESEDIWKAYFKNGKMQKCEAKITFEEFNPEIF